MSIKKVTKLIGNIGEAARKYSNLDNEFFRKETAKFGEGIRDRLLDGLVRGYDIDGHQFSGLKESTMEVRGRRGISGSSPLRAGGGIEGFLSSANLFTTGTLQVKLNSPNEEYMTAQNEGFTPSRIPIVNKKDKLVFIKNAKGINVPARKWFGIPKTYKEGGTKYNEFLNKLVNAYNDIFNAAIKKG